MVEKRITELLIIDILSFARTLPDSSVDKSAASKTSAVLIGIRSRPAKCVFFQAVLQGLIEVI